MPHSRRVVVHGPAYLDRVLLVDGPLGDPGGQPLDQSVDGVSRFSKSASGLALFDPPPQDVDPVLRINPMPGGWTGPTEIVLSRAFAGLSHATRPRIGPARSVRGLSLRDSLGGMGAGYAAALGGELFSALGAEECSTSRLVEELLGREGISHHTTRIPGHAADWTLLITSGPHGDKLPIGFRGCHAALTHLVALNCDLRVAAALPNKLVEPLLRAPGAGTRFFAPAMRNALDRNPDATRFADSVDFFSCNRSEWESFASRGRILELVPVVAVTDGERGATIHHRSPDGGLARLTIPVFPRDRPPRDTNRAGEAFGATLISTLLDAGWISGPVPGPLLQHAAERASAAAALILDREDFGFPTATQIEQAIRAGRVT